MFGSNEQAVVSGVVVGRLSSRYIALCKSCNGHLIVPERESMYAERLVFFAQHNQIKSEIYGLETKSLCNLPPLKFDLPLVFLSDWVFHVIKRIAFRCELASVPQPREVAAPRGLSPFGLAPR